LELASTLGLIFFLDRPIIPSGDANALQMFSFLALGWAQGKEILLPKRSQNVLLAFVQKMVIAKAAI
jgi:hypothetical protein